MATLDDVLAALAAMQVEVAASRQETADVKARLDAIQLDPLTPSTSLTNQTPAVVVEMPVAIPLATPERYSGDPNTVQVFLTQVALHLSCKPKAFPTSQARVAFLISYLAGNAAQWAVPLVSRDDPILCDWGAFREEFLKVFDRRADSYTADREMLELRQGSNDLVQYLNAFRRLVAETKWPVAKQTALFHQGLCDELKDAVAHIDPQPKTCEGLINLVLRLEHRLSERKGDHGRKGKSLPSYVTVGSPETSTASKGEPMDIGAIRASLTATEKESRRKQGLCLYCGKKGHYVRECPAKPKTSRYRANRSVTAVVDVPAEN